MWFEKGPFRALPSVKVVSSSHSATAHFALAALVGFVALLGVCNVL